MCSGICSSTVLHLVSLLYEFYILVPDLLQSEFYQMIPFASYFLTFLNYHFYA